MSRDATLFLKGIIMTPEVKKEILSDLKEVVRDDISNLNSTLAKQVFNIFCNVESECGDLNFRLVELEIEHFQKKMNRIKAKLEENQTKELLVL